MHPITDIEKMFALFGKMFENQRDISQKLTDNKFPIDTYDDDPNGTTGILVPSPQYNGPWVCTGILASWAVPANLAPDTASFVATGDATATLPAGAALAGFEVSSFPGAAAGTGTITVAGVVGGPFTYSYPSPSSNVFPQSYTFPVPMQPANPTVPVTVTFNGTANTGNGQITAYPVGAAQTVTLQLGDRIIPLSAGAGVFAETDLYIQLQHDDVMKFTVTPAAACHIELMGWANKRRTDTAE